jgi:hypothetical protein
VRWHTGVGVGGCESGRERKIGRKRWKERAVRQRAKECGGHQGGWRRATSKMRAAAVRKRVHGDRVWKEM